MTLLVGLAGLIGVLLTLIVTSRREKARSEEETKRQEMRLKAEESRLLNVEGRAALAEFLAKATAFRQAARGWPSSDEDRLRQAVADLRLAVARVQITCSVKVAGIASMMETTARVFELYDGPDGTDERSDLRDRFTRRHHNLIRTARDELGLNEPKPDEERSKSWLVAGRTEPPEESDASAPG